MTTWTLKIYDPLKEDYEAVSQTTDYRQAQFVRRQLERQGHQVLTESFNDSFKGFKTHNKAFYCEAHIA